MLLASEDKEQLCRFWTNVFSGLNKESMQYHLVEYDRAFLKGKKLAGYGLFKNPRTSIVGVIEKSDTCCISFGYLMEHVVLKATEIGLGTCWLGDFDPYVTQDIAVTQKQIIPAVCLVGYAAEQPTLKEKLARFAIRASRRRPWSQLFFDGSFSTPLVEDKAGHYAEPLELLRLAPSARNAQPWKVVKEYGKNVFHFYKQIMIPRCEKKKLHDIDLGIAMCHFELGCAKNKLNGHWQMTGPQFKDIPANTHYILTWMDQ
ncbi:hypothetical protein AMJ87_04145 [candidate division WOR_3 bacterium SM23_60]|uniref:Putative nitroreductase TM1586 domain-containing protein n=1 Tax=candidate division WOR_3 bacterium SM23_60 TaxID=1703780 RepID=A0A0S8GHX1_UNCW3|nr:MAG: hypothetical protein AMJ87_04145 [candidate division WOR_3 bacterium SM23_60]